jgi:3-dehydroquinate dehydratase-2
MQLLLLNGPNLNTLGQREPHIYGYDTVDEIVGRVRERAKAAGADVLAFQSNHEGALIDFIQQHQKESAGLIINPGAFGHYGYALRDAIAGSGLTAVEVHISNVYAREQFRHALVLSPVCKGVITGLGWRGYLYALDTLIESLKEGTK